MNLADDGCQDDGHHQLIKIYHAGNCLARTKRTGWIQASSSKRFDIPGLFCYDFPTFHHTVIRICFIILMKEKG